MLFLNEAFFIINNNYDIQVTYKICQQIRQEVPLGDSPN